MYPPDEKELDRLSAMAAEHYQPPGAPSWDALEQMLDTELPLEKEKKRRGLFLWFLLPGILLGGGLFWHYHNPAPAIALNKNRSIPAQNQASMPGNHIAASTPRVVYPPAQANTTTNRHTTTRQIQPGTTAANNPVAGNIPVINSNHLRGSGLSAGETKTSRIRHHNTAQNTGKTGLQRPPAHHTNDIAGSKNNRPAGKTIAKATQVTALPGNNMIYGERAIAPPANDMAKGQLRADTLTAKKDPAATAATSKKKTPSYNGRAISIGITGGIDMSTVKFDYADNAGYNIGLTAGYHFSKHWAVYTGAVYTQKNYKLSGEYYNIPAGTWLSNYNLDMVTGYCRMWEVPVTARYTFNPHGATRLFVGGGLSSYFMKQEYYTYNFKVAGNPRSVDWKYNNNSDYWFSIVNFSAGIEKQLGSHLFGQIEPYAKLPLAGLGYGKIQLSSFGLNFTLQYRKKVGK